MTTLARLALASYTLLLAYWMLIGFGRTAGTEYMYNLRPFATISHFMDVGSINTRTWAINLIGNIGVFVPFGLLIPAAVRTGFGKSLAIFLAGLTILELSQLLSRRGSLDVDDFILNSFGFVMGYGLLMLWRRVAR
ncbi:VanZ family protein [Paenibacillus daejeonensis]|uniref:VanZ family protein n=1 Tax=Paenibacillus daejeonensis TaxID=135193 RepID=UPI00037AFE9A|nr:VanZ family protein [Paenibacillus daejeonensis]